MSVESGERIDTYPSLSDVFVVIPALNEARSLQLVLADLPRVGCVIVVDNGSSDGTAEAVRRSGATVVYECQRGYGAACLRGLDAIGAIVEAGGPTPLVVAFLDAYYSDYPDLLPAIVQPILDHRADFVLGSRLQGKREPGSMPPQSVYGNRLACFLMHILFAAPYTDLGPFRGIRYDKLGALRMDDRDFGWTLEMQIKALRHRLRIREIPVPYRARVGRSKISGTLGGTMKAGGKILYTIAKYGWHRSRHSATTA